MRWIDRTALILTGSGLWALALVVFASNFQEPAVAYSNADFGRDVLSIIERCDVVGEVEIYDHPWGEITDGSLSC